MDQKGPARDEQTQAISSAVFANDNLWLLQDNGSLVSIAPSATAEPRKIQTSGKIREICKSSGRLLALVSRGSTRWSIEERTADGWAPRAEIPISDDKFVAMTCNEAGNAVTLVTDKVLYELNGNRVRSVELHESISSPIVHGIALASGDFVWVGFNLGEWGGGLSRISRTSGRVQTIEHNKSKELCGGPLNTSCDPVHGLAVAPWNPSCIVAAIGLVHMAPHGRIVEVCGDKVRRLYFKPEDFQPPYGTIEDGEPSNTVAFFGLARVGEEIWALGTDGLYRFKHDRNPDFQTLPKFEERQGGYRVSFELPGVALVATEVNQRASVSGPVPIMAVR